jgi:hypothetical protein
MSLVQASDASPALARSRVERPSVCHLCRGPARSRYCWCCQRVCRLLEESPRSMPGVVSVRRFCAGDHWNVLLRRYKDAPVVAARRHFTGLLRSELELFLTAHGQCLDALTGGFKACCVVPTSRPRSRVIVSHPLESVLDHAGALTGTRLVRLLPGVPTDHLAPSRGAFVPEAAADQSGTRILLVDDCWVTGARALSAVVALRSTGVDVTGILVLGRLLQAADLPQFAESSRFCSHRCLV